MSDPWQANLFTPPVRPSPPAPYVVHVETSRQAAVAIRPAAGTQRARVLALIENCASVGATDEEIAEALHMNPSSVRPRRGELEVAGFIRDSGKTRATKAGLQAVVWRPA